MDISHKFSIDYNATIYILKNGPRWHLAVYTHSYPQTKQIEKVDYSFQVTHDTFSPPIPITSRANNFALLLDVYAGPKIDATVYFTDGQRIEQRIQIVLHCPLSIDFCNTLRKNVSLSIFTTSQAVQSDTEMTYTVRGRMSYLKGSGIPGQKIDIVVMPVGIDNKMAPLNYLTSTLTDGTYEDNFPLPGLLAGDYKVIVRPEGKNA